MVTDGGPSARVQAARDVTCNSVQQAQRATSLAGIITAFSRRTDFHSHSKVRYHHRRSPLVQSVPAQDKGRTHWDLGQPDSNTEGRRADPRCESAVFQRELFEDHVFAEGIRYQNCAGRSHNSVWEREEGGGKRARKRVAPPPSSSTEKIIDPFPYSQDIANKTAEQVSANGKCGHRKRESHRASRL